MEELDYYELAWQARAERIYRAKLLSHPDCRDPEHPGCELCEEDDTDKETLQ